MDYIDQLARLRLSRQQAAVLTQLYDVGATRARPMRWAVRPSTRAESASVSRMMHRLRERGYIVLLTQGARQRYTHVALTDAGRDLAAILKATLV